MSLCMIHLDDSSYKIVYFMIINKIRHINLACKVKLVFREQISVCIDFYIFMLPKITNQRNHHHPIKFSASPFVPYWHGNMTVPNTMAFGAVAMVA